jgi:hypothetical protein
MTTNLEVANEILRQFGGSRFVAMTGARQFVGSADSLRFRIPMKTRDGSNVVVVTLLPSDEYRFETYSCRGSKITPKTTIESGVFCDTLRETFERVTGLYTSL